jgi:hypothetical protein
MSLSIGEKDQLEALDARVLESYQNGGRERELAQIDEVADMVRPRCRRRPSCRRISPRGCVFGKHA